MAELDPEELKHLQQLAEVSKTASSAGWIAYILPQLHKWVSEAHEDMVGASYGSNETRLGLMNRWQQREAMVRGLESYISECEADRLRILQDIEDRRKELDGVPVEG